MRGVWIKWFWRTGSGLLILLSLLLIAGFVFERMSRADAERIPPDGDFVQVEGHRLHYLRTGEGGPTVVFETAFDPAGHLQWMSIQKDLPKTFTTISYDRAGVLWSERGINPKSGEKIADELHALLAQTKAPRPYILVGHSFGGTLTRFFVRKYPQDVAGVILVDSQFPGDQQYLSPELHELVSRGLPNGFLRFANTFGLARLMFRNMFPDTERYTYENSIMPALLYKSADAVLEEQERMKSIKREAVGIDSFHSIPLLVITAADRRRFDSFIEDEGLRAEMLTAWDRMQKDLLNLSTDSRQVLASGSGHYIHQDQPELIENAIETMVEKVGK